MTLVIVSLLFNQRLIQITTSPYTIYNSTVRFRPETSIFERGAETRITILVDTGGERINAAQAVVAYDPTHMRVKQILTWNSFCDSQFFLEKIIDPEEGRVSIACIIPQEGFSGNDGVLAEMIVEPFEKGNAVLTFEPETQILAHDGLGTNVLRLATDSSYEIVESSDESGRAPSLRVFSPTCPNSERWYATSEVSFNWSSQEGDRYRYSFNQVPDDIPGEEIPYSFENSALFPITEDGTHFLHLMVERNGLSEIVHQTVHIDNTAPPEPTIRMSAGIASVGEIVRFEFLNNDQSPSYQKGFYVSFDGGIYLPVLPELNIPFLEKGHHTITLKIFDSAGNSSQSSTTITVTGD